MKIAVFYHHIREAAKQAGMTEEQVLVQLRKAGWVMQRQILTIW